MRGSSAYGNADLFSALQVVVRVRKRLPPAGICLWSTCFDKHGFNIKQGDSCQRYPGGLVCTIHRPHLAHMYISQPVDADPETLQSDAEQGLTRPVIGIAARLPVPQPEE